MESRTDSHRVGVSNRSGEEKETIVRKSVGTSLGSRPTSGQVASDKTKDSKFILRSLDRVIGFSLFMLVFGVPLFFTGLTSQGIVFEKQIYFYIWLLLGVVSWTAKGVIKEEMDIRRTPLDIPIVIFWFFYLISSFFSIDRWHSFWGAFGDPSRGFMNVTAMIIAYYLIISNFNKDRMKLLFTALVSSGSVLSIWTLIVFFNIPFTSFSLGSLIPASIAGYIPLSLIGSIGGLGVVFSAMIVLVSTAILKVAENEDLPTWKRKFLTNFLLFVLAVDLFLVLNISGYVIWSGLFTGIVLFLIYILSKIVRPHRNWVWLPMVLFVLVMIVRMTGSVSLISDKINLPVEVSPDSFLESYRVSRDISAGALKDNFILGSGPATYAYDFSLYKPQDLNKSIFYNLRFSQGSGIFFEAIATIGFVGASLLLILLLSYLSVGFYFISREKSKNKLYSLGIFSASIVALVAIVTTKMEGSVLFFSAILVIFAIATTLFESENEPKYLSLSLKASPKFALALAFIFMLVSAGVAFLFVFLGKIYVADVYAGRAVKDSNVKQEEAVAKMGKAIGLNGREGSYYTKAGVYYMMLANSEALKPEDQRNIDNVRNYINYSITAATKGLELNKDSIETIEALAQIYENSGMYVNDSLKLAGEAYQKALLLEPHNPNFFLKLGQIKVAEGSTKKDEAERKQTFSEARDFFQKAVDKKDNFAPGYYQLALVQDALGENDKAIENATRAAQLESNNVDYLLGLGNMYRLRAKEDDLKSAQALFRMVLKQDENNINAHFYLGLAYEKDKNKDGAKEEYRKIISLIPAGGSDDTKKKLEKMISNIDKGVENTPESLGLIEDEKTKKEEATTPATDDVQNNGDTSVQDANEELAPAEETTPAE